ncbi:LegC family aminotransferase [Candidatus Pelagibacter sp. HIMB1321]|uniref:LegC family aminotransferase n=1 Tax=Candidatus Pelagibacter sp. HIMB1321 TaxID=1388755 RepID=UPI000A07E7A8|nr:LegC family aminotransferase [Candidatus Pelagibacter sp. HIMB1321]SMF79624.1 perosamine synthetase [Candidatus Pelagibacter sp. HIMB1321]
MIPLHEPTLIGNEKKYINECLSTNWISTSGKFINLIEKKICDYTGSKYAIAVNSGTSALHIGLLLSNVKPNDEIIVPTVSFIAPINAIKYCDAHPVFMDVNEFLTIDVNKTIEFLENQTITKSGFTYNKKTKKKISAMVVVHVFGNLVDLKSLVKICKKKNIELIEDSAESFGSYYNLRASDKIKHAGTIGRFGCLSFNGNKTITSGGGGAILTQNKRLAKKARYLITQSKDNPIKFIHNNIGFNYKMTNLHAAIGLAQIECIKKLLTIKKRNHIFYRNKVLGLEDFAILNKPVFCESNYWLNLLRIKKNCKVNIDNLIKVFDKYKIQVRPLWYLNHLQTPFKNCQSYKITYANKILDKILCLPSSASLTKNQITKVIHVIKKLRICD